MDEQFQAVSSQSGSLKREFSLDDQILIERLVDGELGENERRLLLSRLDNIPNGWRFCALSFLEEQTLRSTMREMISENIFAGETSITKSSSSQKSAESASFFKRVFKSIPYVTSAAIVLFGSIVFYNGKLDPKVQNKPHAVNIPIAVNTFSSADLQEGGERKLADVPSNYSNTSNSPIQTVKLNCPQYGLNNVSASCVEKDHYTPSALDSASTELPAEIIEQLKQSGGQLDARRDEYRFSLGDGRVLILPVDSYNVNDSNADIW